MSFLARFLMAGRRRVLAWSPVPRLGVRLLAVTPDRRVLMVRHTYIPGWHLPGGGLKTGETAAEGALREAREETGCSVDRVDGLLGLYANFSVGWSDHVAVYHSRHLTVGLDFDGVSPARLEIAEVGLFPADRMPEDTCPSTVSRVEEWLGRRTVDTNW